MSYPTLPELPPETSKAAPKEANALAGSIENLLKNPRVWRPAMLASVAIAIGYVIKQHVGWMETADKKSRMLVHQLTFWGSTAVGLTMIHGAFLLKRLPFTKIPLRGTSQLLVGALGGTLGALGFPAGRWLSHKLYPSPHEGKEDSGKREGDKAQAPQVAQTFSPPELTAVSLAPTASAGLNVVSSGADPDNPLGKVPAYKMPTDNVTGVYPMGPSPQATHPVVLLSPPRATSFGLRI